MILSYIRWHGIIFEQPHICTIQKIPPHEKVNNSNLVCNNIPHRLYFILFLWRLSWCPTGDVFSFTVFSDNNGNNDFERKKYQSQRAWRVPWFLKGIAGKTWSAASLREELVSQESIILHVCFAVKTVIYIWGCLYWQLSSYILLPTCLFRNK